jgi:hypothetical protein
MYGIYRNCHNLVNAGKISSSVISASNAFGFCNNLVNINTENQLTSVISANDMFVNCRKLVNYVDLTNCVDIKSMIRTYQWCTNIQFPSDIDFSNCSNLTQMYETFVGCKLNNTNVVLPPNLVNMHTTFYGSSLTNAPIIPNSVIDMHFTFHGSLFTNAPIIPNSVIDMRGTFESCHNLVNAPEIPESVNILGNNSSSWCQGCFDSCINLTGDVIIHSNQIEKAYNCFNNTSLTKNVYIPFNYTNGETSATYNAFINAGYGTNPNNRKDGVCLYDLATYQN